MNATRNVFAAKLDEATEFLTSQDLRVNLKDEANNYLSSVMSTVNRLPSFEYNEINGYCYLSIKSKEIITAKHVRNDK